MARSVNLNLNWGMWNAEVSITGIVSENSKAISFHQYHKQTKNGESCNGSIGYRNFCKKCGEDAQRSDIFKGYEIADKVVPFSEEEIAQFQTPSGIQIIGMTKEEPKVYQIKKCYLLDRGSDKKTEKLCTISYELVKNYLKRNGVSLVVKAKTTSRGIKSAGDLSLIRYAPEQNRLILVSLYYSEEVNEIKVMADAPLPIDTLSRVADKTFFGIKEIGIASISEEQSKRVMDEITEKMGNPLEEGKAQKPKISEEEQILARMLA